MVSCRSGPAVGALHRRGSLTILWATCWALTGHRAAGRRIQRQHGQVCRRADSEADDPGRKQHQRVPKVIMLGLTSRKLSDLRNSKVIDVILLQAYGCGERA